MDKYRTARKYLFRYFNKPAEFVSLTDAEHFVNWLGKQHLDQETQKTYVIVIKACWDWGLKRCLVEFNPWNQAIKLIRVPPKQIKPFSREEAKAILQAFRNDRYYSHYADYVEFLLGTGARTGEVIGLKWRHVSKDCSSVWIGESLSRGVRKATKTNKARTISLTTRLQAILQARKALLDVHPDALVFTGPKGGPIDERRFQRRAWKSVLSKLGIEYRKPYATRSTMISHQLEQGMSPITLAQMRGMM